MAFWGGRLSLHLNLTLTLLRSHPVNKIIQDPGPSRVRVIVTKVWEAYLSQEPSSSEGQEFKIMQWDEVTNNVI